MGFYNTTYDFVGNLEGRFFDSSGEKTSYLLEIEKLNEKNNQVCYFCYNFASYLN